MKTKIGALLFGAAVLSLFVPKRRTKAQIAPPAPPTPEAPRKLYALVQVKPNVVVLALSARLDELEREIVELNETWNRWDLRSERRSFQIQAAPVLISTQAAVERPREEAAPRR